jgi:hypothetical protein
MDETAKALFEKDGNHPLEWAVVDEACRLFYRLKAQERVRLHQAMQNFHDETRRLGLD